MAAAFSFAVPSTIPQDLQIIQDIIGEIQAPILSKQKTSTASVDSDHDHGTDSDTDSEKEVEADIFEQVEQGVTGPVSTSDSDSSSSSESESDSEDAGKRIAQPKRVDADMDDDEDAEAVTGSESQVRTKNEVVDVEVVIPEIEEVAPHEQMEKVGDILSIVDKVVIVKGIPSSIANRGSEKALDSDTLLVFEDRKVFGYIFETFGPTMEPLYQIRFNQKYPLDPEKVKIGRPVFHVPAKSNYVFVQQLRHFKGSDASNVHDEEPGEDEVEFSDDEQEAAHKRAQAQRREQSRARSVGSSRHSTPLPSRMRDQDMVDDPYGGTPFDDRSYNDLDLGAGPSRPPPIPYDDPYSDAYGMAPPEPEVDEGSQSQPPRSPPAVPRYTRGRGRGGPPRDHPPHREDGGRGRGRGRRQNERSRGRGRGRGGDHRMSSEPWSGRQAASAPGYDPSPRPPSPTSIAMAQAAGQYSSGPGYDPNMGGNSGWGYSQYPMQPVDFFPYQYPQVQPHINPRFAANFGMAGMGMGQAGYSTQSAPYSNDASGYAVGSNGNSGWGGDWTTHAPPDQDSRN